ncbi:MAG: hypothetical protein WDN50_13935 [Bradyrhizobium sp.]
MAQAPVTTLTVTPVVQGGSDYQVQWTSQDDAGGSGVKNVTVYVSADGGDYSVWLNQTTATSGIYNGLAGHTYKFVALATDNAGNHEQASSRYGSAERRFRDQSGCHADPGRNEPGSRHAAGAIFATIDQCAVRPGRTGWSPSSVDQTRESEFQTVLAPFTGQAFATGIAQSGAGIGPMALLVMPDGSVLVSGGASRNELFKFSSEGGQAGTPLATLPEPIYDLVLDTVRNVIWAATGGGPLYELDAGTGAILGQFGDSLTQGLAIQPGTGLIYVSSGNGIEIFDPTTDKFSHFSDIRVGSLAFAPDGTLWAVTWPHNQGQVIAFTGTPLKPQLMLSFDDDVNSIAFGLPGSSLAGLLFVSHTDGSSPGAGTVLSMVDLATMRVVDVATGGTRDDIVRTSANGRIFLSQSHQVDVLGPVRAPHVASTNPPPDAFVSLPFASITVTFDDDMLADSAADPRSVLDPDNYDLRSDAGAVIPIQSIAYDKTSRTAGFELCAALCRPFPAQGLDGRPECRGLGLAEQYTTGFTVVSDVTSVLNIQFSLARSDRDTGTVLVRRRGDEHQFTQSVAASRLAADAGPSTSTEKPVGAVGRAADGSWLIDLSSSLPGERHSAGRTIDDRQNRHGRHTQSPAAGRSIRASAACWSAMRHRCFSPIR